MSYCVNCGVELSDSAKKCPLCDTPVINPNALNKDESPAFPKNFEIPKASRKSYIAFITSLILLLPNIVCVITNLLMTPHLLWSVYVVSSSVLIWFLFIFPFLMKKSRPYLTITADAVVTAVFIFVFYYYNSPRTGWFWTVAVPIDAAAFITIGLLIFYFRKKRSLLKSIIAYLTALIFINIFICLLVFFVLDSVLITYFTAIIAISCIIMLVFFIVVERNYRLRAWLSRKFFF